MQKSERQRISQNEWATWRADPTTKRVMEYLKQRIDIVVEGIVDGAYKNYSEVERARGIIEGLREIHETPRGN